MWIKVDLINDKAKIPSKSYDKDFCYDIVATSEEEVAPNVWKYGTGLRFQIQRENECCVPLHMDDSGGLFDYDFRESNLKLSIDIRPRSSIYKTGMVLSNSVGTVDEDYTGEVSCFFYHVFPQMERYHVGDKIAQMKVGTTYPISFEKCTDTIHGPHIEPTDRGGSGFGSTGK